MYIILLMIVVYLTEAYESNPPHNIMKVYIPAIHPRSGQIRFYPVVSRYLVLDSYRNRRINVTINSFSDFLDFPNIKANSHFIPISDTGHGMTLHGTSALRINEEINKIVMQIPEDVRKVTFYQYKDKDRFPHHNIFSGLYSKTHLPPHQNFFRATWSYILIMSF